MTEKIKSLAGDPCLLVRTVLLVLLGGAGLTDAAVSLDGVDPVVTSLLPPAVKNNPLLAVLLSAVVGFYLRRPSPPVK